MAGNLTKRDSEDSLAIRAAWLHYAAGLTQSEVAKRLGVTSVKAHRLIMRANENGAIKITIDGDVAECVVLEQTLVEKYALDYCEVVPDLQEEGLPLRGLGIAGAGFLQREIESGNNKIIGIGHGRTLASAVAHMHRVDAGKVCFVSLLGGLAKNYSANPHDVMYHLAEKTGAAAYVMPVPFFANTVEDREVLLAQRGISDVMDLAEKSDLMFVGIGSLDPQTHLVSSQTVEPKELLEVQELGGKGEMLGHFFDSHGKPLETQLAARTISLGLEALKGQRIVAIAGGKQKTEAIRSILNSGCLRGLITDERTALALAKV